MCQKVDSKDFNLGELKMTISSSLAGQNNETKDLFQQIAIPNHTNNPSESFRVIIGKGSCFVIKTFNLSLIVKLLITAQHSSTSNKFPSVSMKQTRNVLKISNFEGFTCYLLKRLLLPCVGIIQHW